MLDQSYEKKTDSVLRRRRKQSLRRRILFWLGMAVVITTMYMLILPAITMEARATYCGLEEHVHTEKCLEKTLICGMIADDEGILIATDSNADMATPSDADMATPSNAGKATPSDAKERITDEEDADFEEGALPSEKPWEVASGSNAWIAVDLDGDGEAEYLPGHIHTEECYETRAVCGIPEHEHTEACYEPYQWKIPEDAVSWAAVEKPGFAAMDSELPAFSKIKMARAAEDGSYDFSGNITKVTVSKLENGQWKPGTEFTDGDYVRVNIDYSLPEGIVGSGNKEIHYRMPEGITLNKETGGTVYDGSTPVGTYTITENGLIRIVFNDDFADDRPFTGTIQFQGTAHASESGEDNKIDFGAGGSITVKPNPKPTDVQVKKEGSYSKADGKLHYALTVSTTQGTSGAITVNDAFQSGNTQAHYDTDSFQIIKVDANGQTTPVTGYAPTITTDGWDGAPEKFTIAGLPELKAGEAYRITYTATMEKPSSTTGESSVNNSVNATTEGGDNSYNGCTITIFNKMIVKEGKYDDAAGTIEWTITLNPDKRDISGWVLEDTITANGVTVTMPKKVTLTGSNGSSQKIELPYIFPEGSTDSYTITYQTPVTGLKPGEKPTVTNNATIDGDNEHYQGGTTVGPSAKEYHVWKNSGYHDSNQDSGSLGTYQWNVGIDVPANITEADLDNITYTDKLYPVTSADGTEIPDSHYITAQQLGKLGLNQGLILGTDYKIFDLEDREITDFNSDTRYTGFKVKFTASALDKIRGQSVHFTTYYSTVDYTKLTNSGKYTFKNWGSIPGHETESSKDYEKPPKLEKQASATGNQGSFTGDGVEIDYAASDGVIHYRLLLRTDASTKGAITVTDRLPRGAKLVEESVKLAFYGNDYYDYGDISLPGGSKYTASEHIKTSVGAVNTDGTTPVTFTIDDGYNGDGTFHTLVLYYDTSIKDDPIWTENPGLEGHLYRNEVTWDGESTGTDVTVDRDVPKLAKTGAQLPQYDEDGNPLLDETGNPILSNTVRYYVTINQGVHDLDPTKDVLELKDTLTLPSTVAGADLNVGSVRLYRFDANAENHCGEAVNPARYSYIYDQATHTLTFTVPDSMAMVLVYEYTIDRGQAAGELQLSNKAALTGVTGGSTEDSVRFQEITSSATVTKRTLTIYKVDGENFGKTLPGAEFCLEAFSDASWKTINNNLKTDQDGQIVLNLTDDDGKVTYQPGILYRLTETKAPEGYAPDDTPKYFVWIGTGETVDQCKEKMAAILNEAKVLADDVLFISNSSAIYVPNTSTTLTVQKVWIGPDGGEMENPGVDSIDVKLWQQPVKTNAVTVTITGPQDGAVISKDVAEGSSLTIGIQAYADFRYSVNGGEPQSAARDSSGTATVVLDKVTQDTTINLEDIWLAGNAFAFTGYTAPYYTSLGKKSEYETVTLKEENGWSYTWTDLPQTNNDGQRLHYTIEETPIPGFHESYSPNNQNGIQTGELVVTNQASGYELPETGGPGYHIDLLGLLLAGAALSAAAARFRRSGGNAA